MPNGALESYFEANQGRFTLKWRHYFEIYERHFSRFRGTPIVLLEIGVYAGGSLDMWQAYFGPEAKLFGLDIDPRCAVFERKNVRIFIGSQSDRLFLREVKRLLPPVDILIDDGGHRMKQQNTTFDELFDVVKPNGVYICEDVHTSYWREFGGGYKRRGTFIEKSKGFIDSINAWYSREKAFSPSEFTASVASLHFYPGIVVIEKHPMVRPRETKSGLVMLPVKDRKKQPVLRLLYHSVTGIIDTIRARLRLRSLRF